MAEERVAAKQPAYMMGPQALITSIIWNRQVKVSRYRARLDLLVDVPPVTGHQTVLRDAAEVRLVGGEETCWASGVPQTDAASYHQVDDV